MTAAAGPTAAAAEATRHGAGHLAAPLANIHAAARRPVPADSVAAFRVGFGLLVAFGAIRFLAKGWVTTLYLAPEHHLTYRWFEWVRPLPAPYMQLHMIVLAALGLCIAAGYRHRLATGLFIVGFAYTELIEAALYLNHYWFITLAAVLLLVLPVHHRWSIDAATGRVAGHASVAAGVVWALRAQLAVVYVFAGLAKLNADWMLHAQPMRLWLADRTGTPLVGPVLDEPAVAFLASWAGAAFDCTIVFWLLWPRSRRWAYLVLIGFHLVTGALFRIGVFPWVMIVGSLIFFAPDWPRRVTSPWRASADVLATAPPRSRPTTPRATTVALGLLAAIQLALPLRHHLIDGDVAWTEEGYYLSWRVMLVEKVGHVEYDVTDPTTGRTWTVGPELVLTDWQATHAAPRPDMIHATARLIAEHYADQGLGGVQVRADAWVSMNGRAGARLVDPDVDLAAYPRGHMPAGWILDPGAG